MIKEISSDLPFGFELNCQRPNQKVLGARSLIGQTKNLREAGPHCDKAILRVFPPTIITTTIITIIIIILNSSWALKDMGPWGPWDLGARVSWRFPWWAPWATPYGYIPQCPPMVTPPMIISLIIPCSGSYTQHNKGGLQTS